MSAQAAAPSDVPPAVVTHHTVKIGGKTIASKTVVLRMAKAEKKGK